MLRPAAINALLSQLITVDPEDTFPKPHTALISLLESSELYAIATRLSEANFSQAAASSVPPSTSPPSFEAQASDIKQTSNTLTLDERATCLSAIAVTAWRQAATAPTSDELVVSPGAKVPTVKHAVTSTTSFDGRKAVSYDLAPLLLECHLGKILVMPIVPSRSEFLQYPTETETEGGIRDDVSSSYLDTQKPCMLLVLNAEFGRSDVLKNASLSGSSGLAYSTATLAASQATRSRLRSGRTTPTSVSSDATATPSRSPVSENFTIASGPGLAEVHSTNVGDPQSTPLAAKPAKNAEEEKASQTCEEKVWSDMYSQAKAFAQILAPSLVQSGVGEQHHQDELNGDGRRSGQLSEDDADG